jgi:anti-anti-sigma factor
VGPATDLRANGARGQSITTRREGHCSVVTVAGRLDWASAAEFRATVRDVLASGPLVVDISRARCDAAGNGALMGAAFEVNTNGGAVALVTDDELETEVLEKIGLSRVVPVYRTMNDAIASVLPVPRAS